MGDYHRGSYHAQQPVWRQGFNKLGDYIGVELEVESRSGYLEVLRLLPNFANRLRPVVETDASLTQQGVEIVFPPFLAATLKRRTSVLAKSMQALSSELRENSRAGMHLNINTRGWSATEVGRLVAVINNLPREYLERIGQRRLTGYCDQRRDESVAYYAGLRSHNTAAQVPSSSRVEIRFPLATANHDKFVDLLEFVKYVIRFARYQWRIEPGIPYNHTVTYISMREQFNVYMNATPASRHIKGILQNGYT